jgi:dTDP-4-dehydrorhamnose 3,5-epimerase-like enzyme
MDNQTYTEKVDRGEWPSDPSLPLDPPYEDARGRIQNLVLKPVTSTAVIASRPGTVRANHYHKTDWHYSYVVSGRVLYFERDVGDSTIPEPKSYGPGVMFFTPPMREHCMVFPEETVFFTMAKNVRSHESHESDVVRVDFVSADVLAEVLRKYG